MIARLIPTARAMSSICASRTPRSSKSRRVAEMISASRNRRRAAVPLPAVVCCADSVVMGTSLGRADGRAEVWLHARHASSQSPLPRTAVVTVELRPLTAEDAEAHCAGEDELTIRWLTGGYGTVEGTK